MPLRLVIRAALRVTALRVAAGRGARLLIAQGIDPASLSQARLVLACMSAMGTASARAHGKRFFLQSGKSEAQWLALDAAEE